MRLWHSALIPVLPRQQLMGQWRELNSIFRNQKRHVLINFVYENRKEDLLIYSSKVVHEMIQRYYKVNLFNLNNYFFEDCAHLGLKDMEDIYMSFDKYEIFPKKMTYRYLVQCYFNLQEKHDCGSISDDEWGLIFEKFKFIEEKK